MLKLLKNQYLNSIFQLNYTKYEKKSYDTKSFTTYKDLLVYYEFFSVLRYLEENTKKILEHKIV